MPARTSEINIGGGIGLGVTPRSFVNTPLRTTAGAPDMNVNGSITPVEFFYLVPERFDFVVTSMVFVMLDGSVDPGDFGGINNGLTNGLELLLFEQDGTRFGNFFGVTPIKKNVDIANFVGINYVVDKGSKKHTLIAELGLTQSNITIIINSLNKISITVRDDLTSMDGFQIRFRGFLVTAARD